MMCSLTMLLIYVVPGLFQFCGAGVSPVFTVRDRRRRIELVGAVPVEAAKAADGSFTVPDRWLCDSKHDQS